MPNRTEHDALGSKKVPAKAYFGIHTQRARENFQISGRTLPLELFYAIAQLKIAFAKANHQLGFLDSKKTKAIVRAAQEIWAKKFDSEFVIDAFQAGAGTPTHMNVNEVIANRAIEWLHHKKGDYRIVHPNDDVNRGQSTNNVFPSALTIVAYDKIGKLIHALQRLHKSLQRKQKQFKKVLKTGRTHLQDAVPITLGQEFGGYAVSIQQDISRLREIQFELLELNLGGNAIGTGINTSPAFAAKALFELRKITHTNWKLVSNPIQATYNQTRLVEASAHLQLLAIDLSKICNDLRLLSSGPRGGFNEIRLPAIEPGSSIMPGKVNPSMAEMLNMVCIQVLGNHESVLQAGQAGQLELNVMTPVLARNLLESLDLLTNGVMEFEKRCVRNIQANKTVSYLRFEQSEGLATLLNPLIGYDAAAKIGLESLKTGKTIREIILQKKLLTPKQVRQLFDYKNVTRPNLKPKTKKRK